MHKHNMLIIAGLLIIGLVAGVFASTYYHNSDMDRKEQRPVLGVEENPQIIKESTNIVYEQTFTKCGHTVISEFANRQSVLGKTKTELDKMFLVQEGFTLQWKENELVIKQTVDDWCQSDKQKLRLKIYQGYVAVYQGPTPQHDVLIRVTRLNVQLLPDSLVKSIKENQYEFSNEMELNDALENFDEYY